MGGLEMKGDVLALEKPRWILLYFFQPVHVREQWSVGVDSL